MVELPFSLVVVSQNSNNMEDCYSVVSDVNFEQNLITHSLKIDLIISTKSDTAATEITKKNKRFQNDHTIVKNFIINIKRK